MRFQLFSIVLILMVRIGYAQTDWYSYRSGDWNDSDSWTLDPSGSTRINPSAEYPDDATDNVIILNGDEILLNFDNLTVNSVEINSGGIIEISSSTTGHDFTALGGEGKLQIASDDFPAGDYTNFISSSGGTVEFIDQSPAADYELASSRTFNNVIINLSTNTIVLKADYTVNGNLAVESGTLQINDNTTDGFTDNTTPLNITVNEDITVDATGSITVGDVDASVEVGVSTGIYTFHQLELLGDLTNNGSMVFTNLSSTSIADGRYRDKYPTSADADNDNIPSDEFGVVELVLTNGSANQLVTLNGTSDFYRIDVSKGNSQTFIAEFNASSSNNFRLLGRIAMDQSDDVADAPSIDNYRALGLEAGILKLGDNIVIDQIASNDDAGTQGGDENYIIDSDAQLWLASNASVTKANEFGIHLIGKLKVTDNAVLDFSGTNSQKDVLVDEEGTFEMTGGTVNISSFRSNTGSNNALGSFIMTGGTLNIGGADPGTQFALFSIPWEDQAFILSAADEANPPTINVTIDAENDGEMKDNAAVQIGVKEGNYSVDVSNFNIINETNTDYKIASSAPFYNLTYSTTGTGNLVMDYIEDSDGNVPGAGAVLPDGDPSSVITPGSYSLSLVVLNDLSVESGRLEATENDDVTIGNILSIADGAEYEPGTNTTYLNGSTAFQTISLNGSTPITNGVDDGFYNLSLSGSGTEKRLSGDLTTVVVRNDLTIGSGVTFADNGNELQVNGDIYNAGTHSGLGKIVLTGGAALHTIDGDGDGKFTNLELDDTNGAQFAADMIILDTLTMTLGILDIDAFGLILDSDSAAIYSTDGYSTSKYVRTAGNASDEGISKYFAEDRDDYLFPMGTDLQSGTDKYTPVTLSISGAQAIDSGYVKISVADEVLPTINPNAPLLDYYWRVNHSGFNILPDISLSMFYNDEDIDGNENNFNGGYVLDELPFTRTEEDANDDDVGTNKLVFNGTSNNEEFPGNRFEILNANFSAAGNAAWNDAGNATPEVYYSSPNAQDDGLGVDWEDAANWSSEGHWSTTNDYGDYPQEGDIAVIGFTPDVVSGEHRIQMNADNNVAQLIFAGDSVDRGDGTYFQLDGPPPQALIDFSVTTTDLGFVSGTGYFRVLVDCSTCNTDPSVSVIDIADITADFGDFVANSESVFDFNLEINNNTAVALPTSYPDEYPSLEVRGRNGTNRTLVFQEDITVNQDMTIRQHGIVRLNDGADGDIEVLGNLVFSADDLNELEFPTSGTARTITVYDSLKFGDGDNSVIEVINTTPSGLEHRLRLGGSIDQQTDNTIDLFTDNSGGNNVILELFGESDESYETDNNNMSLYRLEMNKGTDATYAFTFNEDFTIGGSTNAITKSIDLQNGNLVFNNSAIDIELNTGNGDFEIPETASLELQAGTARISATGSGSGNGMRLDGKLTINGGDAVLADGASGDNYVEYGTGGSAEIELTSGNLLVGSQLRRGLFTDEGVITYTQSGGTALFGVNDAPEDGKGVFEIINSGVAGSSSFDLSGATTVLALVNGQTNPVEGSFIIGTDVTTNVTSDPYIDFGYNATVAGIVAQNDASETFEINSASSLPNIRIDNANNGSPILEMVIQSLTVSNDLQILNSGTFTSNNFDLTINGDLTNNGTYNPGTNITTFTGGTQQISGTTTTTFNDLVINPTTSVTLNNSISVSNDLSISGGLLDDNGNTASVSGDLSVTTEHVSDGTGGISMDGTSAQQIDLPDSEAEIDYLIINNTSNVTLNDNSGVAVTLTIDDELAINNGLLEIGDNRLLFDNDATATSSSSFDETRMISVNGVKKSDGVEREFLGDPTPTNADVPAFTIPVGTTGKYTPVTLDVDGSADAGSVLVKPINATHPSATGSDALNYYWVVTTDPSSVASFTGSIQFNYLESDANNAGQNEDDGVIGWGLEFDYKAARLLAPVWSKPPDAEVDTVNNTFTFDNTDLSDGGTTTFDGEYTIGNDIPDELAQYRSNTTGIWDLSTNWDVENDGDGLFDDGNQIPQPGSIIIVDTGDEITMSSGTDNDQNVFSVQIDGILDLVDSDGHNFGDISGTGTLRISDGTLPGGDFDEFFTTTGGILELAGTMDYTIDDYFSDGLRGLVISGGGTKTLPVMSVSIGSDGITVNDGAILDNSVNNNAIVSSGAVTINNGSFLLGNSSASLTASDLTLTTGAFTSVGASIDLSGNLSIDGGTFNAGSGAMSIEGNFDLNASATFNNDNGSITFDGTANQNLTGDYSTETLNNIEVNKASGSLVLGSGTTVSVNNTLTMTSGNITTTGATLRLLNGPGSISRTSGFVNGPLQVDLDNTEVFSFPIGKSGSYNPLEIAVQAASQSGTVTWEAEYYLDPASSYSSAENSDITSDIETNTDSDEQVTSLDGTGFWRIDTNGATATAETITLDLSGLSITDDNINDQDLQIMVWDNDVTDADGVKQWDHLGGISSGSVATTANVVSSDTLSFSEHIVVVGSEDASTLPVELLYFNGSNLDESILLEWATASEVNNDYFEIQHSIDGEDFQVIGIVDGSGNSNDVIAYEFIHDHPVVGSNFYRLRQVDFDGQFEYSQVIFSEFRTNESYADFSIVPNPATSDNLHIIVESNYNLGKVRVKIVSLQGKIHLDESYSPENNKRVKISPTIPMDHGLYMVFVEDQIIKVLIR